LPRRRSSVGSGEEGSDQEGGGEGSDDGKGKLGKDEMKLVDVSTYEDKDGDWMLVGDVLWSAGAGVRRRGR